MSRDWTPRELYEVEQWNIQHDRGSLWDFMENTTITINGKTTPLHSKEAIARRREFPFLGRLMMDRFDGLYAFLSKVDGGLSLLARHEDALRTYIETGKGDKESPLIRWFEGKLDSRFYYREHNDELLIASIKDEVGKLYRFDPAQGNCFWFALNDEKCISVWYAPDAYDGDQLQMKLEQRAEDGSMGPFCEVLIDESYGTADLSYSAVCSTLQEIYEDAGIGVHSEASLHELTDKVMFVFGLRKKDLESQIQDAVAKATAPKPSVPSQAKESPHEI